MNKLLTFLTASIIAGSVFAGAGNVKIVDNSGTTMSASIAQKPFYQAVAEGKVTGHSAVNKFGHNPAGTTGEDVWSGGGAYAFYPTNGQAVAVFSTDADDSTSGTGARTVTFFGLNTNWVEISETITLTGTTPIPLSNEYLRMYRGVIVTAGSTGYNEGTISVTNGAGLVAAYIAATDGQTQQAVYTVPAGKSAYFIKGYVGIDDDTFQGQTGSFKWKLRPNNGVTGAWSTKGQIGCVNIGSSWWQYEYGIPVGPIPEKTDIRIELSFASAEIDAVAGFDLLLVDD